ncbi:MAG TPA: protein kinase [Planctomycetota bacterium]|nr:protein kinase [Planctomycetota bacterium]
MPDAAPPSDDDLDRVDRLLLRARDGADVSAELAALPEPLRAAAEDMLRVLGKRAAPADEPPGARTVGSYRLLSELGRGGQASVWLAEDLRLRRRVAIKLFRPETGLSAQGLERVRREALAASRLHHPGICPVHDTGVADGQPYLVMSWLDGETFAQRIARWRERGAAETSSARADRVRTAVTIVERTARALHAAHEVSVVHRDVKPGNVMLVAGDQPVVLDFGLARLDEEGSATLTLSGEVFGTPVYMSPEQVEPRGRIDARADVWALGVMLYEAVALRRPFEAPTRQQLAEAILRREPVPLRSIAGTGRDLDVIVATALSKERDRRYRSAEAFADDLRAYLEGRPVAARPLGPLARAVRWCRRRPAHAALLAVGLLALVAIGGLSGFLVAHRTELARGTAALRRERVERLLDAAYFRRAQQDTPAAVAAFEAALREVPDSFEAVVGLWLVHAQAADRAAAEAVLARWPAELPAGIANALRAFLDERRPLTVPRDAEPRVWFAAGVIDLAAAYGDVTDESFARAVHNFTQCLLASPESRRLVLFLRAEAAAYAFDVEVCRQSVAFIERNWPGLPESEYWAGMAIQDVDAARAEASFRRALELDPTMHAARRQLARLRARAGARDEAVALIDAVLAEAPLDAENWCFAAEVYEILREPDRVATAAGRLLELHPRHPFGYLMLSTNLLGRGEVHEAIALLRRGVEMAPHPGLWVNLGVALDSSGATEEATTWWRKVLDEGVRNAHYTSVATWNLGFTEFQRGRWAEGLAKIARAMELQGNERWIPPMDALLGRRAEFEAAERAFEDWLATRAPPADPRLCLEIAARRGLYAEALEFAASVEMAKDRSEPARCWAAVAAVQASIGAEDPAGLRARALAWLREELAAYAGEETEDMWFDHVVAPREWQYLRQFAPVFEEDALAALPEVEQAEWRALWAEAAGQ